MKTNEKSSETYRVQFIVQSTCITYWLSLIISSPQSCTACFTIRTNNTSSSVTGSLKQFFFYFKTVGIYKLQYSLLQIVRLCIPKQNHFLLTVVCLAFWFRCVTRVNAGFCLGYEQELQRLWPFSRRQYDACEVEQFTHSLNSAPDGNNCESYGSLIGILGHWWPLVTYSVALPGFSTTIVWPNPCRINLVKSFKRFKNQTVSIPVKHCILTDRLANMEALICNMCILEIPVIPDLLIHFHKLTDVDSTFHNVDW